MIVLKRVKKISLIIVGIFFLCNIQVVQGIEKEGRIHKNIFVENIDLSNLTKEQAKEKINEVLDENNELSLIYKNNKYTIK